MTEQHPLPPHPQSYVSHFPMPSACLSGLIQKQSLQVKLRQADVILNLGLGCIQRYHYMRKVRPHCVSGRKQKAYVMSGNLDATVWAQTNSAVRLAMGFSG